MSGTLRDALFRDYREGQGEISNAASYTDVHAQWPYFEANYGEHFRRLPRTTDIIEVGPGHGGLLAWLRSLGFERIEGVDASPGDVQFANSHLGAEIVTLGDACEFLSARRAAYDVILTKAVLEHVAKNDLFSLLSATAAALKPGGFVIIDVPNMDWLLATHERYMDLTHEVGFTRQSLSSLLRLAFDEMSVKGSRIAKPTRAQRLLRTPMIRLIQAGLYVLGEGADGVLFSNRSLVAVASKPRVAVR